MYARRSLSCCVLILLAGLTSSVSTASAQLGVDINRARPASGIDSFVTLDTTRTPGHLRYSVSASFDYSRRPLVLKRESGDIDLIRDRYALDLGFEVGLGSRLAVGADVPFILRQSVARGDLTGLAPLESGGFGDPRLRARLRVLGDTTAANGELPDGPGLALAVDVSLPVGTERAFSGEGAVTVNAAVLGDFHLLGLAIGGRLGWKQRSRERLIAGVRFREQLEFGLGARVPIPWIRNLDARAELRVATDGRAPFSSEATTAIETDLTFGMRRGDLLLTSGVGFGLTEAVGSPRVRALLALTWSPSSHDADGDGIPDDVDQCPHLPEDIDGYMDDDGCMDPDNDNDFIPDSDDRCPNDEALEGRDADEDGCTDPARDTDGDGIDDAADACPREAEDMDGVEDEDGCPDPDPPAAPAEPAVDAAPEAVAGEQAPEAAPEAESEPVEPSADDEPEAESVPHVGAGVVDSPPGEEPTL